MPYNAYGTATWNNKTFIVNNMKYIGDYQTYTVAEPYWYEENIDENKIEEKPAPLWYSEINKETKEKYIQSLGKMAGFEPKAKPKKKQELIAPEGYHIITNENHIILENDMYYLDSWGYLAFASIKDYYGTMIGKTLGKACILHKEQGFRLCSKEPRFKTDKPFPHGY